MQDTLQHSCSWPRDEIFIPLISLYFYFFLFFSLYLPECSRGDDGLVNFQTRVIILLLYCRRQTKRFPKQTLSHPCNPKCDRLLSGGKPVYTSRVPDGRTTWNNFRLKITNFKRTIFVKSRRVCYGNCRSFLLLLLLLSNCLRATP